MTERSRRNIKINRKFVDSDDDEPDIPLALQAMLVKSEGKKLEKKSEPVLQKRPLTAADLTDDLVG
jgi:hypothetical protein